MLKKYLEFAKSSCEEQLKKYYLLKIDNWVVFVQKKIKMEN